MFEVEYFAVREAGEPIVVEKVTSRFARLVDADKSAKSLLEAIRRKHVARPPDGYRIRARDGRVVLRYLDRAPRAVGPSNSTSTSV